MEPKLLVRVYNVGLGDCIYVRVPDGDQLRHILIDCGNKYGTEVALKNAIDDLKVQLNEAPLDLLVVTHSHEDHVRGFDAGWFKDIKVRKIWLSVGMDSTHPQAAKVHKAHALALSALAELKEGPNRALATLAGDIMSLSKADGVETVKVTLPEELGISPQYVHSDTPAEDLQLFNDQAISLKVLAPMKDIDGYYVGKDFDASLDGFAASRNALRNSLHGSGTVGTNQPLANGAPTVAPRNIGRGDFRQLQHRLLNNALGFALKSGHLVNNTSVVLLLEWHGRRLLFTGDAEANLAHKGVFTAQTSNGSWNVMWHVHQDALKQPLDFLKVGHHGSLNATPWADTNDQHILNEMFDAMLPIPGVGETPRAHAVISTERTNGYKTIPSEHLLQRLGARVANGRQYNESESKGHFVPNDVLQPQRTDLENQITGQPCPFIDVEFTKA